MHKRLPLLLFRTGTHLSKERASLKANLVRMFLVRPPAPVAIKHFVREQQNLPYAYAPVGGTRSQIPAGYTVDHNELVLGTGEAVYRKAVRALQQWRMFDMGWLSVWPQEAPLREGTTVVVLAQHFGFWSLNPARIIYVINEQKTTTDGTIHRFGFAYGALPGHAMSGEERFLIEWNESTDDVVYEIVAYSKPRHLLARLGYPLVRRLQKRFGLASLVVMRRIVRKRSLASMQG